MSDRFADGRWFRILTVVDQYTRECLCIYVDRSQSGEKVVQQMKRLVTLRGAPESITTDNGHGRVRRSGDGCVGTSGRSEARFHPARPACAEQIFRRLPMAAFVTSV